MEADFDPSFEENSDPKSILTKDLEKEYNFIKSLPTNYWYFVYGNGLSLFNNTIANIERSLKVLSNFPEDSKILEKNSLLEAVAGIEALYICWIEGYESEADHCLLKERMELKKLKMEMLIIRVCD